MMNKRISVVIPTYNRADLLSQALHSLVSQSIVKEEFEVIVIDDGSPTLTSKEVCERFSDTLDIRYFRQDNSGIASAKNLGVMVSVSPVILFFDDDDLADSRLLEEHLSIHERNPQENIACLGFTTWHESLKVSPLMNYVTDIGQFLFSYQGLRDGDTLDYTFFWGGRTSAKRSLLMREGLFNQKFRFGSEDIELGYRLSKFGLKVLYNAKAKSYMNRSLSYEDFLSRSEKQGRSQYQFALLHPEPEIQIYCQVANAEQRYSEISSGLASKISRTKELEEILEKRETPEHLEELFSLYYLTFNSMKAKGIVEEKAASPLPPAAVEEKTLSCLPSPLTQAERELLLEQYPQLFSTYLAPHEDLLFNQANRGGGRNILVIDPTLPAYDKASGLRRLFEMLRLLARAGNNVTFLAVSGEPGSKYQIELEKEGVRVIPADPIRAKGLGLYASGAEVDFEKLLKEGNFDLAIIDFYYLADLYIEPIRRLSPRTHIAIDTIDIHWVREAREAELADNDEEMMRSAQRTKAREKDVYSQADSIIAITREDESWLEALAPGVPSIVIPNIHELPSVVAPAKGREGILFVGNFRHPPNIDAARFLGEEVMPEVEKLLGDVPLTIIGGAAPPEVQELNENKNINVLGWVEDIEPYLQHSRLSVAPLRYGAGLKGKIGESLSYGLPVVTTPVGAEGMNDEVLLIAESAQEIAEQIAALYRDDNLWNDYSLRGREFVSGNYSPQVVTSIIEEKIPALCAPRFEKNITSIIMLVRNQKEVTEECINSLLKETSTAFELILIDNGSHAPTAEWLHHISANDERITLVRNDENLGFGGGNNQGMALARGEYICLLNNDVVLTPGWLEKLLWALEKEERVGLAGPVSNYVAGAQRVHNPPYEEGDYQGMLDFALYLQEEYKGQSVPSDRLVGFALLVKREVIEKIGGFDPLYGLGNFEDDDLAIRAAHMGYEARIVPSCFIHHYGNRTFKEVGIDWQEEMKHNWKLFQEKWGVEADALAGEPFDNPDPTPLDGKNIYSPLPLVGHDHAPSNRIWKPGSVSASKTLNVAWRADWYGSGSSLIDTLATAVEEKDIRLYRWHSQEKHVADLAVGVAYERKPNFNSPSQGPFILATSWDMSIAPPSWAKEINKKVDQLWLPSDYCAKAFIRAGVAKDMIRVIPPAVESERFSPEGEKTFLPGINDSTTVYLFVGEMHERHGLDILLEAWEEAFSETDDVALVIRPSPFGSYPGSVPVKVGEKEGRAQVIVQEDDSRKTLPALYRAADVAVFPYRGAGDYPAILEAMASGLPVIAPNSGIAPEILGEDYKWLLPTSPETAGASEIPLDPNTSIEKINSQILARVLKEAHAKDKREELAKGLLERAQGFNYQLAAEKASKSIYSLAGRVPIRRLEPVDVEGRKETLFGLLDSPLDGGEWQKAIRSWAEAFSSSAATTLAIASRDNRDEEVISLLVSYLEEIGADMNDIADIVIVNLDGPVEALEMACDFVIESGSYKPLRKPLLNASALALKNALN